MNATARKGLSFPKENQQRLKKQKLKFIKRSNLIAQQKTKSTRKLLGILNAPHNTNRFLIEIYNEAMAHSLFKTEPEEDWFIPNGSMQSLLMSPIKEDFFCPRKQKAIIDIRENSLLSALSI